MWNGVKVRNGVKIEEWGEMGMKERKLTFELHLEDLQKDAVGSELVEHTTQELSRYTHTVARDDQATSVNDQFASM